MIARIATTTAFLMLLAFCAQTFFASVIAAEAEEDASGVSAQVRYDNGKYYVRGMAMVPSTCHRLSVRPHEIDPSTTAIVFETWEEPYRYHDACKKEITPRSFQLEIFASKETHFKAMVDTKWVTLSLVQAY